MSSKNQQDIFIKGARMHNLKNIDVQIPRNQLTVVTGVSGSGKSSLVFDTLFAEGQRRYVESLSAYARQFLGKMNKPDVDFIHGLSPSIAIEQKVNTRNPRSTIATSTEIYDYLKLLFARVGTTYSPVSWQIVKRHRVQDVVDAIIAMPENSKVIILAPIVLSIENVSKQLEIYIQNGFSRLFYENEIQDIESILESKVLENKKAKKQGHLTALVVDRFAIDKSDLDELQNRIADSVQTAFYEGQGNCMVQQITENNTQTFEFNNRFELDGMVFEEPSVNFFSFNNPYGACKTCEGFGSVVGIDEDLVIPDKSKSVFDDAIVPWKGEKMSEWKTHFLKTSSKVKFPIHKPYYELSGSQKDYLWHGDANWEGIDGFFKELERQTYKIQYRVMLARYRGKTSCPDCKGTRLRKDANYVRLKSVNEKVNTASEYKSLSAILLMTIDQAFTYFSELEFENTAAEIAKRMLLEIVNRLQFLKQVGLGYLSLNRLSNTLSGGETQRINLATSLGSSLVGSTYILDEPSIGLHSKDTEQLIGVLKRLRDIGNTVVVVEHDQDVMEHADHIIDIGPFAGIHGGNLVAAGTIQQLTKSVESLTGKYLAGIERIEVPIKRRKASDFITVKGARQHNLKGIKVSFPLHTLTVITGVSGSGKSTLIKGILYPAIQKHLGNYANEKTGQFESIEGNIKRIKQVEFVDQNPIGKSSRSNPITYIKAYDAIRELYANQAISKGRAYKPQHFSFNVDGGRCETCQGEGEVTIEMQFMADIHLTCESCKGARFKDEILDVKYEDKNISEVLHLSVDEAIDFFAGEPSIANKLKPLQDVGLGYVQLGQSSNTLSGGESQRVKLASYLGKGKNSDQVLFIFDEPTTGLHFNDIKKLLKSFDALIAQGHSIIVIEHNLDVIKCADYIIDLGPEAGENGGEIVFEGTPEELIKIEKSYTAHYLKDKLN